MQNSFYTFFAIQTELNESFQEELLVQNEKRMELEKLIVTQEDNIRDLNLKVKP